MHHDAQYRALHRPMDEAPHQYGPNVHLLSFPYPMSLLAELCAETTRQPRFNQIVAQLYDWMLGEVASRELTMTEIFVPTRMRVHNIEGFYAGQVLDRSQKVVVAALARAGILPGQRLFDSLNYLLEPESVRQDHVFMGRKTDAEGRVIGVDVSGSKLGGTVEGATVLIPDPMGATGGSLCEVLRMYREDVPGPARRLVAMHLIVTPEHIARVTREAPDVQIYAVRVDRGLSAPDVLDTVPGERHAEERGLNDHQYIVPGAGGLGELMNNSWV